MPTISNKFLVNATPSQIWTILNDPISLGSCIPGCEEVVVLNPNESKWKIKINAGVISKRIESKSQILESEEPVKLVVKLDSVDRDFSANFTLNIGEVEGASEISFVAEVSARGPFQWMVDQILNHQLKKMMAEFAERVSKKVSSL